MTTTSPNLLAPSPTGINLLADYEGWLNFVDTSRLTIRQWDDKLAHIATMHTEFREWVDYLRSCMHHRTQFFGSVAILLTGEVAQLRNDPNNTELIRRLTNAQPMMQTLVTQLVEAFADVDKYYRVIPTVKSGCPLTGNLPYQCSN